jgi:hypothetical protein
MSEAERPDRLAPGRTVTVDDIRTLAGPATPHFALQIRNRVRRLIDPLPDGDPVRAEGEREIARLEDLAQHSGEPRGMGRGDEAAEHDEGKLHDEGKTHGEAQ